MTRNLSRTGQDTCPGQDRMRTKEDTLNFHLLGTLAPCRDVLNEPGNRSAAEYVRQITFNALLKAANDPKIPFEVIEKTVSKKLNTRVALLNKNPFEDFVVMREDRKKVCKFLKAFVKHGKDDSYVTTV